MSSNPIYFPHKPNSIEESHFIEYLKSLYSSTTSTVGYSGPRSILSKIRSDNKYTNIGINRVRKYLSSISAYGLNKPRYYAKGKMTRYVNNVPRTELEADLLSFERFAASNSSVKYLLTVMDVNSRELWVAPLKDKKASTVLRGFKVIIPKVGLGVRSLYVDKGSEFTATEVVTYLRSIGINITYASLSLHAHRLERAHRSLRQLIRAYQVDNGTDRFIDVLDDLVGIYNNRPHSSLYGSSPTQINDYTAGFVQDKQSEKWMHRNPRDVFRYKLGDKVRLLTVKGIFSKHMHTYTQEVFEIEQRVMQDGVAIYTVKDCSNETILGKFYGFELSFVQESPHVRDRVDRIISEKERDGVTYVEVTFKGQPQKCTLWVKKSSLTN